MAKKLMEKLGALKERANNKTLALVTGASLVSTGARAEFVMPTEAQAVMTNVTGFVDAVISWGWTVVGAMAVGFIGWKLVKKSANKAT